MTVLEASREQRVIADTTTFIEDLLGPTDTWDVGVRLWDDSVLGAKNPAATVVLEFPWSLRRMLWPPSQVTIAEAFIYGDVDVDGDIEAAYRAFASLADLEWLQPRRFARLMRDLLRLPAPPRDERDRAAAVDGATHSIERDRQAVRYHYDVGNDFYRQWLDGFMQYSCAYFCDRDDDLDSAQRAKLEHICRKLRLKPGDRLLDIGSGWGGLLEYAVANYNVTALGVTLSEQQAAEANTRFERAGIDNFARVEVMDYREVVGEFDKIVSVGMVEHVGKARLAEYFQRAYSLLVPGGVFLCHGISVAWDKQPTPRKGSFVHRYVFPDGELVPISLMMEFAEREGFEVRDVESLREHYALTLRHWVSNLQAHRDEAVAATDETTYRIWRLYMSVCAHNFERGILNIHQSLLLRPTGGVSGLPPTRADWYGAG